MNRIVVLLAIVFCLAAVVSAQADMPRHRTLTKTDRFDFKAGGTVAITGAPSGSIEVTGTNTNEIEITAEIKLNAGTDAGLDTLASVTGFATDEGLGRAAIITVGNHNKFGLKKLPKNFPKDLISAPFTVNYVIRVPRYSDLEIDGGKGDLSIQGVEGSIRVNFVESNARIEFLGGMAQAIIAKGKADVSFGQKGWRGRLANVQIAEGDLTVRLPTSLSADIDAVVLRSGAIENGFPDLKPRDRKVPFTERSIIAKAGVGGVPMKFVVGDGKLKIDL